MLVEAFLPSLVPHPLQRLLALVISGLASVERLFLFHLSFSWFLVGQKFVYGSADSVWIVL